MKQKLLSFAVLMLCLLGTVLAQNKQVTGIVTSDEGEALAGVSVDVRGTTTRTSTNAEGKYTIAVPDNAVLIFRYVGIVHRSM
jgi:hypothetical protein